MPTGAKILDTVGEAIRLRDKVLIILSEASVGSNWVEREVKTALAEEDQRNQVVLFPICLDEAVKERLAVRHPDEIDPAFATASHAGADGMIVFTHGFVELNQARIIDQAARYRMPTMYGWRDFVMEGGLMSYGPDVQVLVRQVASYVDRIIKGENPGHLPVQLEFIVNLKTARALDPAILPMLLARADEVIE
jgi:putative ABC transport system substrate-binding protein